MKTVVLTGIRRMELREIPLPALRGDRDVLVRVARVGVCGSDVHYYTRGRIGDQVVEYPFTVGHEAAGVVEAAGMAVSRVSPGDRIAIEPAMSCGRCDQCRSGRPNTCRHLRFLSCPGQASGCLSEYVVVPQESCFPVPPSMTLEEAAFSEPLAIAVYAVRRSMPIDGAAIGVLGAGPIGLGVLLAARSARAARIYATDKVAGRIDAARRAGAVWAGSPEREDVTAEILEREPLGLDAVFECCGQQEALDQAVDLLKPGGKLVLIGIPPEDRITFSTDEMRRREISLLSIRRQSHCVQPALDLIAGGEIDAGSLITHRFALERTQDAFDLVDGYRDGVIKAMIAIES
ncbi:MAG: alcohol dehydrogenase catalytic domain-containing protein [Planctomycetes bacterium]|nr:alcohol dehydrogenase catalytic domain-containing protein [Planctomycetota bacterium]